MKITKIHSRQILDSRGNPTVETDVYGENGIMGRAAVPSGVSTGTHEAVELRDNDKTRYLGEGVLVAVQNVNNSIATSIVGMDIENQEAIDHAMITLDTTENKQQLGANAILSVSLAAAKAAAMAKNMPLYAYVNQLSHEKHTLQLPVPLMNIINGGKHAAWAADIQEFMILPVGGRTFHSALRMGSEIFHHLAKVLTEKEYTTTVGDEGGFAPLLKNGNAEALDLISLAVQRAGYKLGQDIVFGIDAAASEFYHEGKYTLKAENKELTSDQMIHWLTALVERYPIVSIEDGLSQEDWDGWKKLTATLGDRVQIVGDDLFVTNTKFIQKGINEQSANAVLVKLNQIGTLTETIAAVDMANKANWQTIISHRSGETEDTTISHIAVGLGTGQIKSGSLSRSERIAKYNELLRIEEQLGTDARYRSMLPKPIGF